MIDIMYLREHPDVMQDIEAKVREKYIMKVKKDDAEEE